MKLSESQLYESLKGKKVVFEYTMALADCNSKGLREYVDNTVEMLIGADTSIVWAMGGKIFLEETKDENGNLGYGVAYVAIYPGYNAERHLYAYDAKIYVEDDYVWCKIPDIRDVCTVAKTVYSDQGQHGQDGGAAAADADEPDDPEEDDGTDKEGKSAIDGGPVQSTDYTAVNARKDSVNAFDIDAEEFARNGGMFLLNFENYRLDTGYFKYEPLVVNDFNLDNPVRKVEIAYKNALSEIESNPGCGFMILLHDGHFYIPVESIEDPVNRDVYYYIKVFNSYGTGIGSPRAYATAVADVFDTPYEIAFRYRAGYSIKWREYILKHILPSDYIDQIYDYYSVADKPLNNSEKKEDSGGYDGLDCEFYNDGDDWSYTGEE